MSSSISTLVDKTVTPGSAAYSSPLTITSTGIVVPTAAAMGIYGATGVYSDIVGTSLINEGAIHGGIGAYGVLDLAGGSGGVGVDLFAADSVTNSGRVIGGAGGASDYGSGGTGGVGVEIYAGTFTNTGSITGGVGGAANVAGGAVSGQHGGNGGIGVYLDGGTLTTSGTISGGHGGTGPTAGMAAEALQFGPAASTLAIELGAVFDGAIGGFGYSDAIDVTNLAPGVVAGDFNQTAGVMTITTPADGTLKFAGNFVGEHFDFTSNGADGTDVTLAAGTDITGTVNNEVTLQSAAYPGGALTVYSTGVVSPTNPASVFGIDNTVAGSTLINSGTIDGREAAVYLKAAATVTNTGRIAGNYGGTYGVGGGGVLMLSGTLTNTSTGIIAGGGGHYGYRVISTEAEPGNGFNGGFGISLSAATVTNSGSITGGAGGSCEQASAGTYTTEAGNGGAGVVLGTGAALTNASTGSITGGAGGDGSDFIVVATIPAYSVGGAGGAGVILDGGTLTTSGTISGGTAGTGGIGDPAAGDAVLFGAAASTMVVEAGAVFHGDIGGFALGDIIDITNLTPAQTTADFNGTTHTLTTPDDGTLIFAGNFADSYFFFKSDGGVGTDIYSFEGSVISTAVTSPVTVDSAPYGATVLITSTGSVKPTGINDTAVTSALAAASLTNRGSIVGGPGGKVPGGFGFGSTVSDPGGIGVSLTAGTVTNNASVAGGAGISGSPDGGVGVLQKGGTLTNTATGTITGGAGYGASGLGGSGVYMDGGTLVTAGTISGGHGASAAYSVGFGSGANTMVVESGAVFNGDIGGFTHGDTIDITNQILMSADFNTRTDVLTSGDGTLQFTGTFTGAHDLVFTSDGHGGTDITCACYLRGTRILAERGEVTIESLKIGDRVMTSVGITRPIRWIGRRRYTREAAWGHRDLQPILIRKGAISDEVPRRDLWVSPEHAMYIDGMLIPAAALVNGHSIVQEEWLEEVDYLHLEFDAHAIIYAEGAPSESFVDDESRAMFDNAAEYAALYPHAQRVPARFCAPRIEDGEELESVRQRMAERADILPVTGIARSARCGQTTRDAPRGRAQRLYLSRVRERE